jgi:hypothetical protein
MPYTPAELSSELRTLRKGRGVNRANLREHIGPALRQLCRVTEHDTETSARAKVVRWLATLVATLPDDTRVAATVALGLDAAARQSLLQDRVRWLAEQQHRDSRTIRRWVDEAIRLLADTAVDRAAAMSGRDRAGWRTRRLNSVLRMDKRAPECLEQRWIVAEHDGVQEIEFIFTLPAGLDTPGDDLELFVEPYYGVTLVHLEKRRADRFAFVLRLPRPLREGEEHVYSLITRRPEEGRHLFVPERRCDRFDLRVRFGRGTPPRRIWRVDEVFPRETDRHGRDGDTVAPDGVGEINLSFNDLLPGRAYGAQWSR